MTVADRATGDWGRALRELVAIPPPHRDESMDRAAALEILRCPEDVLDGLVDGGLPCARKPGGLRFDRRDIYNVALHSASGRSLPELGTAFLGRIAREGPDAWSESRSWSVGIRLSCPLAQCGAEPGWSFGRPQPELLGGDVIERSLPAGCDPDARVYEWPGGGGSASLAFRIATRGTREAVVAAPVREAFTKLVDGYRFQVLPPSLRMDVDTVERIGAADCIAATELLVRDCRAAGYEAEPQEGFLLGLFGFAGHRWVRVRDADGRWKSLDPTLAMIAALGGHDRGGFRDHCCGSVLNRVVPCGASGDGEIAGHRCDGEARPPGLAIRARRVDNP